MAKWPHFLIDPRKVPRIAHKFLYRIQGQGIALEDFTLRPTQCLLQLVNLGILEDVPNVLMILKHYLENSQ